MGVIFDKFNDAKDNESPIAKLVLTKEQIFWVDMQKLIAEAKPKVDISKRPANKVRGWLYDIAKSGYFEYFIMICIMLNMLQMAIIYDGASDLYINTLEIINLVFTGIFIMECIIKLSGLGI